MEKWLTISGRFTEEEVGIIEKYKKAENISDNQLVRQGVQLMVTVQATKELFDKPDMKFFRDFLEEWKEILKSPEMEQKMEEILEKTAMRYREKQLKEFEKETAQITKDLKVFDKKRKRGRKSKFEE